MTIARKSEIAAMTLYFVYRKKFACQKSAPYGKKKAMNRGERTRKIYLHATSVSVIN